MPHFDGAATRNAQRAQSFSHAALSFRSARCIGSQDGVRCTFGISRIALASVASTGAVRPIDLDDRNTVLLEEARQPSAVRACAFNPGPSEPGVKP